MIDSVIITPLDIIEAPGGSVMHAMKHSSDGFRGFGEAYFSNISKDSIKAWKRHKKMTLNIIVPVGKIKFVLFDDREESSNKFYELIISNENYVRLTVPPMIWMGFQGLDCDSMLLNIANVEHNVNEVEKIPVNEIKYNWDS